MKMFIVLTIVCLALGIGLLIWTHYTYDEDKFFASFFKGSCGALALGCALGLFVTIMCLVPNIATEQRYDTQIAVIEESNSQLEEQICSAVETYLEHEENVYGELDVTTAIGLYSAYPNLKSNELVQSLINTYQANTEEIKALKLEKTNLAIEKFLVYFGH